MSMRIDQLRVPEGLPSLDRGRHRNPRSGACLMEYVSVLAGQRRRSDKPSCTHYALALLARQVNDLIVDDEVRSRLALLAPRLIGTDIDDPRVAPLIILVCLKAAARNGSRGADLDHRIWRARTALRQADARARKRRSVRPARRMGYEIEIYGALRSGWAHLDHHDDIDRDQWLVDLLAEAVDRIARLLPSSSTDPVSSPAAAGWSAPTAIRSSLRT